MLGLVCLRVGVARLDQSEDSGRAREYAVSARIRSEVHVRKVLDRVFLSFSSPPFFPFLVPFPPLRFALDENASRFSPSLPSPR